jgi:hypothetical protein
MSNIVSPFLRGGLGNYIFQIATAYMISKRDNKDLKVDYSDISVIHKQIETYFDNIFKKIEFVGKQSYDNSHVNEDPITYREIPKMGGNVHLTGYYQNEMYFSHIESDIKELFEIDENTKNYLMEKYGNLLKSETCSLHVRRGDYVNKQNFHPLQTIEYYKNAINIMGEEKNFLIFSDDIVWCENNLSFIKNKTFIKGNKDYQDLYLMSLCNNNIVANSSFSWWGAWMNNNQNKKVIYPSRWFNVSFLDTSQIGCKNWIKL